MKKKPNFTQEKTQKVETKLTQPLTSEIWLQLFENNLKKKFRSVNSFAFNAKNDIARNLNQSGKIKIPHALL